MRYAIMPPPGPNTIVFIPRPPPTGPVPRPTRPETPVAKLVAAVALAIGTACCGPMDAWNPPIAPSLAENHGCTIEAFARKDGMCQANPWGADEHSDEHAETERSVSGRQ